MCFVSPLCPAFPTPSSLKTHGRCLTGWQLFQLFGNKSKQLTTDNVDNYS